MHPRTSRFAAVLLVLIFFISITIYLVWFRADKACACTNREPQDREAPNIKSADSRALASFVGYLKYIPQDNQANGVMYLPLELKSINVDYILPQDARQQEIRAATLHNRLTTYDEPKRTRAKQTLQDEQNSASELAFRMEADCAILTIDMRKTGSKFSIKQMTVVPIGLAENSTYSRICTVAKGFDMTYSNDRHYSCRIPKSYPCKENRNSGHGTTTMLYIERLEFEACGDPKMIAMRVFSTQEHSCQDNRDIRD